MQWNLFLSICIFWISRHILPLPKIAGIHKVFATLWEKWRLTYLKKVFAVNKWNPLASRSPYVIIVSKHSNYAENNCEKIMYGKITAFLGQKFELNGLTIGSPWVWWKVICQMALFPCELTPFCFWLSKNAPRTLCSTVSKKRRGWVLQILAKWHGG